MLSTLISACTQVGLAAINTPSQLFSEQQVERDIAYGTAPHQTLDFYHPAEPNEDGKLVVFVYGGAWTSGKKEEYYFVADSLTSAGYSVAVVDYIKYPEGVFPAFVEDVALSIAWLLGERKATIDFDELVLVGHSAGAHTGALLITDPKYLGAHSVQVSAISAFVGLSGPYGFQPKEKKYRDIFANLDDFKKMQPLNFVNGSEPPMLLIHGEDDTTVLPVNTRKFADKVNEMGGAATVQMYPGKSHVWPVLALSRAIDRDEILRSKILSYLQK